MSVVRRWTADPRGVLVAFPRRPVRRPRGLDRTARAASRHRNGHDRCHEVAGRAAERAARPETIVLALTLAYGASDHHLPFGGTLSLRQRPFSPSSPTFSSPLPAAAAARVRAQRSGVSGRLRPCRRGGLPRPRTPLGDSDRLAAHRDGSLDAPVPGHAGVFETSLILAIAPARGRPDHARPSPGGGPGPAARAVVAEPGRWQELDGWTDAPVAATSDLGEAALESRARRGCGLRVGRRSAV